MKRSVHITRRQALQYHMGGKIALQILTSITNEKDLALAYTPGVAYPCLSIYDNPERAYQYTCKNNMVAVLTDGSAVLGLGDIGPLASIPVMEGKAVLFKAFGDINAFPVALDNVRNERKNGSTNIERFIEAALSIAPVFGGINLEDIAAPACFEIEERLDAALDIPVFHDDQWGTAIISLAALYNYLILTGKTLENIKVVINGAGAAGIRIGDILREAGATNIYLLDSKGVITTERTEVNHYKARFARKTSRLNLADVLEGCDVFIGVSVKDVLKPSWLKKMSSQPAVFALANPYPEITPEQAFAVRKDIIMATGRSDYPNQINNVLGFPAIFRGALDARASSITMQMKIAAARALAELTRKEVPEEVKKIYGGIDIAFNNNYIVPKPFDLRVKDYVGSKIKNIAQKGGQLSDKKRQ